MYGFHEIDCIHATIDIYMYGDVLDPGGRLNIKMPSYQYRDSHVKDKTVSPTVLSSTWESPYLGKTVFILRRGPGQDIFFIFIGLVYTVSHVARLLHAPRTAMFSKKISSGIPQLTPGKQYYDLLWKSLVPWSSTQ